MVRTIKLDLNEREFEHLKEHERQLNLILIRLEGTFTITDTEGFKQALKELVVCHFKLGEQYVWRYHR